ncbi:MAG: glutamate--tRNA ligase [Pseudobdellovibrionaceae bacterium]
MTSSSKVRVRFAPSPTGYLHVGGARTALYNFLYAKNRGGEFILRIEDTDQARSTEQALRMQVDDLVWLGLKWDEGPHPETLKDMGPHGPYKQSQRQQIYAKHATDLLESGKAYYCFLTDAELEAQREAAKAAGRPPQVESPYENMSLSDARAKMANGEKAVVRFKTRKLKKDYKFNDLVRGEITFPSDMVGDFVLLRSDGMPVYNFCCVIDDGLMEISHVLRAEEHLPNTLRQLMIYEALGWKTPEFGHLSIVLDENKQKLSKRRGATSCHEFKMEGYSPEALKNFVALLGWSHPSGNEILSEKQMIEGFSVDRLNAAGAVFDEKKLKWMNATYLRDLPHADLWKKCEPFLNAAGLELPKDVAWQDRAMATFKTSMETYADAVGLLTPLCEKHFQILPEADEIYTWESTRAVLLAWIQLVEGESSVYMTEERFLALQDEVKNKANAKGKHLFQPIRVAIIGKPQGAELKHLVPLMQKSSLIRRAKEALVKMK